MVVGHLLPGMGKIRRNSREIEHRFPVEGANKKKKKKKKKKRKKNKTKGEKRWCVVGGRGGLRPLAENFRGDGSTLV